MHATITNLGVALVLGTKVTAMRNGIRTVVQTGCTNVHIEKDNKFLIHALQGYIQASWEIQVLTQDIHSYLHHL